MSFQQIDERGDDSLRRALGQRQTVAARVQNVPGELCLGPAAVDLDVVTDISEQAAGIAADKRVDKRRLQADVAPGDRKIFSR